MRDLHNNIKTVPALTPRAAIATDTTTVGASIDRQGFESVEFIIAAGVLTDGAYVPALYHDDVSNFASEVVVPATDLVGTIADASFAATDDGLVKKLGYKGDKPHVRLKLVSTGTTSGGFLAAVAVLGRAKNAPVA